MSGMSLEVRELAIGHRDGDGIVAGVSLTVERGRTTALVGPSGCGKSLTSLATLGLLPGALERTSGEIVIDGQALVNENDFAAVRGRRLALVPQDPASSLDPLTPIVDFVALAARRTVPHRVDARRRAEERLERVGLDGAQRRARPDQLSGGQCQRALIALALVNDPDYVIADEPTASLDVTVQGAVLGLLRQLRDETDLGLLLVTHDPRVVRAMADRAYGMKPGGPTEPEAKLS